MRTALLQSTRRESAGVGRVIHTPAPIGGWNTRDPLAAMPPLDAVQLTNLFPTTGEVFLRGGSVVAATCAVQTPGTDNTIRGLYQYGVTSGSPKLFATNDEGIFDVSAGGAVPTPSTVITNGKWNAIQFTNSAGTNYLWGCNGTDKVKVYNGSAWITLDAVSTPAITGVLSTNLIWPWSFKRRIFAITINSMSVWYFPVDSIAGLAQEIPLGPLFTRGGYLVSGSSWSVDGGDGPDDYWAVVTSEGEIAIYQGTDPDSATSWGLVGVYYVGAPLGRRCFTKFGGDVIILTEQGAFPLSKAIKSATIDYRDAVSTKIQPSFVSAAGLYRGNYGFQGIIYPQQNAFIVNIPVATPTASLDGQSAQYVMNTLTGAWCDFSGWNAVCFALFENDMYFGAVDGKVYKCWTGGLTSDSGADILGTGQTAFRYFMRRNLCTMAAFRPIIAYDAAFEMRWGIAVDFEPSRITSVVQRTNIAGQPHWDTTAWDTSPWAFLTQRSKSWRTGSNKDGYAHSLVLQTASKSAMLSWAGTDFLVNPGGLL